MPDEATVRTQTLIDLLGPERLTRIMDIGANPINGAPYQRLLDMGGCEIWGFEPQEEAYNALIDTKGKHEHYSPSAIGDGTTLDLHVCKSDGFTSILPPNTNTLNFLDRWHKAMTVVGKVSIKTERLDDLDDIPSPDLLKIDVQGLEKLIFENGKKKLEPTVAVISEVAFVPLYENQPLFHEQSQILQDQGFGMSKFLFLKQKSIGSPFMKRLNWRKHQGQIVDGDALYIKNLTTLAAQTDEQLKHLAICADAVFASFDLCLKALSVLIERKTITLESAQGYVDLVPDQKA